MTVAACSETTSPLSREVTAPVENFHYQSRLIGPDCHSLGIVIQSKIVFKIWKMCSCTCVPIKNGWDVRRKKQNCLYKKLSRKLPDWCKWIFTNSDVGPTLPKRTNWRLFKLQTVSDKSLLNEAKNSATVSNTQGRRRVCGYGLYSSYTLTQS